MATKGDEDIPPMARLLSLWWSESLVLPTPSCKLTDDMGGNGTQFEVNS